MPEIKFGKIVFETANAGSKSESVQPFLVQADGTKTQVYLEGDNPFENTQLRELDGKDVALCGSIPPESTVFRAQAAAMNPLSAAAQSQPASGVPEPGAPVNAPTPAGGLLAAGERIIGKRAPAGGATNGTSLEAD